jgi:hypothetical protein
MYSALLSKTEGEPCAPFTKMPSSGDIILRYLGVSLLRYIHYYS